MGFFRQMGAAEIFEQVQLFNALLAGRGNSSSSSSSSSSGSSNSDSNSKSNGSGSGRAMRVSNVVFMGMGEPFANYKNVMSAVRRLTTELGIGARHITISTVGITPRIRKLAEEDLQVGLAVSLHQTRDANRSALMPVNNRYPLSDLLSACHYYTNKTNRRISFEWALIAGQTDGATTAHELGQLLEGMLCHVNVIPLNPTDGFHGKPTSRKDVEIFCGVLKDVYGISATARTRRGIDIDAGCGQLRSGLLERRRKLREQEQGQE